MNEEDEVYTVAIAAALAEAMRGLVPFAIMYLGPAAYVVAREHAGDATGELDQRILMLALNKLVIEAGALPAPSTAYAPHATIFTVDPKSGLGTAMDLPFVLSAMRGLSLWAAAGPASGGASLRTSSAVAAPRVVESVSARDLRTAARARASTISPVRTSGCGCRGGSPPTRPARPGASKYEVRCRDPHPRCDCNQTCGGSGCGCRGKTSCADCIPRGQPAAERCACGGCTPPSPETCEPWTPTCETRNRIRAELKNGLADIVECMEVALVRDGRLDPAALVKWRLHLARCVADLIARLLPRLRAALRPAPRPSTPSVSAPVDCLPCSYAVEDPR